MNTRMIAGPWSIRFICLTTDLENQVPVFERSEGSSRFECLSEIPSTYPERVSAIVITKVSNDALMMVI